VACCSDPNCEDPRWPLAEVVIAEVDGVTGILQAALWRAPRGNYFPFPRDPRLPWPIIRGRRTRGLVVFLNGLGKEVMFEFTGGLSDSRSWWLLK